MKQLLFKTQYLDLIASGKKTQTIRYWKKRNLVQPGDIVKATNQKIGHLIQITEVKNKPFKDITLDEAKLDGFPSLDPFYEAIKTLYGTLDFDAAVISFKLL